MKQTRHLFVVLLLLAYSGQSLVAVGAPCFMMSSSSQGSAVDMVGMDHSGHDMSGQAADSGCCDGGGFCSMSECQSAVAVPLFVPPWDVAHPISFIGAQTASAPILQSSSLYRPPIFA
ncbi:MAG: hypothetical protein OEV47_01995 [Gammaproteobacteria bacterium]|nr:hypothetical protein [Gammaproteobacteria bacterium]